MNNILRIGKMMFFALTDTLIILATMVITIVPVAMLIMFHSMFIVGFLGSNSLVFYIVWLVSLYILALAFRLKNKHFGKFLIGLLNIIVSYGNTEEE